MTHSLMVAAVTVEAEGRSIIGTQSLQAARSEALQNASQQALIQAGAYVSSTQSVNQGVLSIDNLRVRSAGKLTNVKVIDERIQGDQLVIRIRGDVETDGSCASGNADYQKSVGVAAFIIQHPAQANLGGLHDAQTVVSKQLADRINHLGHMQAMNAGHIIIPDPTTGATHQQDTGLLTQTLDNVADLKVQFIVSGVIRDMRMFDPSRSSEGNFFTGVYDKMDYRGQQHRRNFAIDVYIHDGFTGALLFSQQYRVDGLWRLDDHERVGFGSSAFLTTEYGQAINGLLDKISKAVDKKLRCEPFRTRIVKTDGNLITFNAGTLVGIHPGDKLTVYRKSTFFDQLEHSHVRLENTHQTMVVQEVHTQFGIGRIDADTRQQNIQQDDVLLAW